jgi:ketosteroid isomerase-like protein
MRYSLLTLLLVSAFVASSCTQPESPAAGPAVQAAQPAAAPAPTEDVPAVITQLEREWVDAIVKKDVAALDRLLASDFSGTSSTAHNYTKVMAIRELKSDKYVVSSMTLDEISVNPYGDVAVAFTSQEEKSRYGGKDTSGHYHFTDVWVKKDGRWQAVASHGTRYDAGHE